MTFGHDLTAPLRPRSNSRHPGTLQRLLRAADRRTDPLEGISCPVCTAADIAEDWKHAAAGDPQDAFYQDVSERWSAVQIQHISNHTQAKAGKRYTK